MPRKDMQRGAAKILALLAGLALLLVQLPASGAPSNSDAGRSDHRSYGAIVSRLGSDAEKLKDFWTPSRIRQALANPISSGDPAKARRSRLSRIDSMGPPRTVPQVLPTTGTTDSAFRRTNTLRRRAVVGPYPYTREEIINTSTFPYSTHGKLLLLDDLDQLGSCSGTVVNSENDSVVWTAGHCVHGGAGRNFFQAALFVPGYRETVSPLGEWPAFSFVTNEGWASASDNRFDVAAVVLTTDDAGHTIEDVIGARGIAFNQPRVQSYEVFGYPAEPPKFDGEKSFVCKTAWGEDDPTFPAPQPIGVGCDMTFGASGGGWVVQDSAPTSAGPAVAAVTSYGYPSIPEVIYGAYHESVAEGTYELASGVEMEPTAHKMTVSLSLSGHLVASGTMKSKDGYKPCTRKAPIKVFRKKLSSSRKPRGGSVVKKTQTNFQGKFRVNVPDKPGYFYIKSPAGLVDDANLCSAAKSAVRNHKH